MLRIALLSAGFAGRIQLQWWQTVPGVEGLGLWNRTAAQAHAPGRERMSAAHRA